MGHHEYRRPDRSFTFRVDFELARRIERQAYREDISYSALMRRALTNEVGQARQAC